MSGTSLDGLDIAFCRFQFHQNQWVFEIRDCKTFAYNKTQSEKLRTAHTFSAMELMSLDAELAHLYSEWILDFISDYKIKPDFISSHGHTVFHQPLKSKSDNKNIPFTTQIGSGAIIAALTGYDVISDFRTSDVALGGQGAPLVPIGDKMLFHQFDYCLNLGGIANISFDIDEPVKGNVRIASDICYANMALNYVVAAKGLAYDDGGEYARKGKVDVNLLNALNNLEFSKRPFPKSIGKEYFENNVAPLFNKSPLSDEDKLSTCCEHIAVQLKNNLSKVTLNQKQKINSTPKILVTGGGAYNDFLIELFRKNLTAEIIIPQKKIIEFKEALIFAFLGVLRFRGEVNVLSSVTGAKRDSCSGAIYKGKIA